MVAVLEKLELSQLEECFSDVAPLSIPHWFINAGVIHLYSTLAIYKPFQMTLPTTDNLQSFPTPRRHRALKTLKKNLFFDFRCQTLLESMNLFLFS